MQKQAAPPAAPQGGGLSDTQKKLLLYSALPAFGGGTGYLLAKYLVGMKSKQALAASTAVGAAAGLVGAGAIDAAGNPVDAQGNPIPYEKLEASRRASNLGLNPLSWYVGPGIAGNIPGLFKSDKPGMLNSAFNAIGDATGGSYTPGAPGVVAGMVGLGHEHASAGAYADKLKARLAAGDFKGVVGKIKLFGDPRNYSGALASFLDKHYVGLPTSKGVQASNAEYGDKLQHATNEIGRTTGLSEADRATRIAEAEKNLSPFKMDTVAKRWGKATTRAGATVLGAKALSLMALSEALRYGLGTGAESLLQSKVQSEEANK